MAFTTVHQTRPVQTISSDYTLPRQIQSSDRQLLSQPADSSVCQPCLQLNRSLHLEHWKQLTVTTHAYDLNPVWLMACYKNWLLSYLLTYLCDMPTS